MKITEIEGDYPNPCSDFPMSERFNTPYLGQYVMRAEHE